MTTEFRFPDVGEGIHEGTIVKWLVKEGEVVRQDQPICEVETDKAVVELPAPATGTVLKLHFPQGANIHVGDVICTIGAPGEKVGISTPSQATPSPSPSPPSTSGRKPSTGVIGELEEAPETPAPKSAPKVIAPTTSASNVLATPAVRKLAEQLNVDITKVKGSGSGGRIMEEDLQGLEKKPKVEPLQAPRVTFDSFGEVLNIPLSRVRKTIAQNMSRAHSLIPPATAMDEADVTELWSVREKEKGAAENKGFKLSLLPFVSKAVLVCLKKHPYLNAILDEEKQAIGVKHYYNLGIAVDSPEGLSVIVIPNANKKTILELASDMNKLSGQVRDRSISLENLKGSTFTITNWGSIGGSYGVPIVNYPEVAILGVGRMKETPVVRDGKIVARKILPLSLTFDHRVLDGAQVARFLEDLKAHLEDPALFLVDE